MGHKGQSKKWEWHEGVLGQAALDKINELGSGQAPHLIKVNELYEVWFHHTKWAGEMDMLWLSIKRRDKQPVTNWRHIQRIKNELVGPECEGIQLFPAESRLADAANQYHIFCFTDPELHFPCGFGDRLVLTPAEAAKIGAVQEPFEDD